MDANTEKVLVTIAASGPITKQGLTKATQLDGSVVDGALKALVKDRVIACVAGTRSWAVIEGAASKKPAADGPIYRNPSPPVPRKLDDETLAFLRRRRKEGDALEALAARLEVPLKLVTAALGEVTDGL